MQERIYHDLLASEEVTAVRQQVRRFAEEAVRPVAFELDQRDETADVFPRSLFAAMASEGLFRIPFAVEDGGAGLRHPVTSTVVAIEELAYESNSVAAIYDVHCILAGHALELGSEAVRRRYLGPALDGRLIGCFATTEPDASSDLAPAALRTVVTRDGDGYSITGHKRFITNAPVGDFVVLLCTGDAGPTQIVVDLHSPGVTIGAPDLKLGNRGQLTADIHLHAVRVPAENLLGQPGQGLRQALATLTYGRIGIGAAGVGMAQAAFDHGVAHLSRRRAFGKRLAEFQHWQSRFAERAMEIENARNLYMKAARRMDDGVEFPDPEAAMAKWYGSRLAVDVVRDALQALGGYGFLRRCSDTGELYRLEQIYRDAKIGEIYEGTNEIQEWIVARGIFGRELSG